VQSRKRFVSIPLAAVLAALGIAPLAGCAGPVDPVLEKAFDNALPSVSLTVYPVMLRSGSASAKFDRALAVQLAERLRRRGLTVTVVDAEPPLHSEPGFNQAALFRENALAFGEYVAKRQPPLKSGEYALQPELLLNASGAPIGVHGYIVTPAGELAGGLGLNSHHEAFQIVNPRTPQDGLEVLLRAFDEEYLERDPGADPATAPTTAPS
jgi:hypothetical protein